MSQRKIFFEIAVLLLTLALVGSLRAQPAVTVSVDTKNPGAAIAPDFEGLSFEVAQLLPNENGVRYFRPDNKALLNLFHTLGIKSLRIGGNTSDRDVRQLPGDADLDSLFAFAKVADVKVIYCLRLHNGDPQDDVQTVKYIMDHYADRMDFFTIGQEPSAYPRMTNATRSAEGMGGDYEKYSYADYAVAWKKFADTLMSGAIVAAPDVKFGGPSVHNNGMWAVKFMENFGRSNHVTIITEHLYPGGAGGKVPTPEIGIDRMLASENSEMTNSFPKVYQKLYDSFVPVCVSNDLPYRLEEVNNYFNGGAAHVSDTFASALWGLDFSWWWAAHGAAGLNFHTGDKVAAGATLQASKYTAYFSTTNGFLVRPLGYGIKAFDLGSHGKIVPLTISNPENLNLNAYAVVGDGKNAYVTIINKEHGTNARAAKITIKLNDAGFKHAQAMFLTAPDGDASATSGETLGGGSIKNDGNWNGTWTSLDDPKKGKFSVNVPACSAVVVACTEVNYDESKVGTFTLTDPLVMQNGDLVVTTNDWTNLRRPEILKFYQGYIFGGSPRWRNMIDRLRDADDQAFGGKAIRKQVDLDFYNYHANTNSTSTNDLVIHVLLYTPVGATNPVPTFLCLSFSGNYRSVSDTNVLVYPVWDKKTDTLAMPDKIERGTSHNWPIEKIIERGYGIALVDYNDIEPDLADGSGWHYGVRSL